MNWRLIKTIRLRDLVPRLYFEIDEDLILRIGIEWVPVGEAVLGVEAMRKLSPRRAELLIPIQEALREKGWMV